MAQEKTSWLKTIVARSFGGDRVNEVDHTPFYSAESYTMSALLGASSKGQASRESILKTWQAMQYDPIIAGALRINVTSALGADQETGQMVHIEVNPKFKDDKKMAGYAQEVADDLTAVFNKHIASMAYNGVAFGDGYARIYSRRNKGVVDLCTDESVLPPLVQPYEVGSKTAVCVVHIGPKMREKLSMAQMARLKLPRLIYVPQPMAVEKAWRSKIMLDDPDDLPLMPSLVGGSFLIEAEEQYYRYITTLNGIVNQRILDSIDETIFTGRLSGMTKEQQTKFVGNMKGILERSKQVYEDALKSGRLHAGRIRHFLPTFGDKQEVTEIRSTSGSGGSGMGRSANASIEDVMLHAKLLSGALGVDISMLGFADILSGGLGEGGYLRTSIQAAERARLIRTAGVDSLDHIADVHMSIKHRIQFEPGQRPWQIRFYGSIAAMESENQRTQTDATNNAMLSAQLFSQLKDSGLDANSMAHMLERVAKMTPEDASLYAKAIETARKASADEGGQGGTFGG